MDIAQRMDSDVILLHVVDSTGLTYGGGEMAGYAYQQDIEQAKTKLAESAAEASGRKVRTDIVISEGLAEEEILKAAADNESDLVLITVGRKGLLDRTLLGATAERVIREAKVPVLSIPAEVTSTFR